MSEKRFTGHVGRTVADTEYRYETIEKHPAGSPNVVYILLDDLGFAGLGCYGSDINTPNMDRLAEEGLRYNNFHTTAICSATRASLLTGANHHAVGVGSVIEMETGCNNANGHIDSSYGTIAEILKEHDYSTYLSGKWHLSSQHTPSGPYDNWPLGKGFDRYYGFLLAETDHYHPQLVRDNSYVEQPKSSADGYHLTEDITDNAIDFIFQHNNSFPEKPFFLYLAYGAVHAPHHAPKEYIERYKGKFDEGWDKIRERWFENQKRLGIIPGNAELTDRAPFVDAWDDLDEKHKKIYARHMEVFAGTLEYTDAQVGRFIDYLKSIDQLDNTIIVLLSDNGASPEGGKEGRINRYTGINITDLDNEAEFALEHFDEIGGEYWFNQYPTGWANALNTPFQWYKTWTHEGGVKDPIIIRYPKVITDKGGIRQQYTHVSDITPTILDVLGIDKPAFIKGVAQKPFTGISFKYSFDNPEEKSRRRVQYYEIFGNHSIYKDGWKAVANHAYTDDYNEDIWELYHVEEDYSEKHNLAEKYPEKLRELQDEFFIEAGRNNVFPLLVGSMSIYPKTHKTFYGDMVIPENERVYKNIFKPYRLTENAIYIDNVSHYISADIKRKAKEEGVIFSAGDRFGGFVLYIKDNKLKYVYNANRVKYFSVESKELPDGEINVRVDFIRSGIDEAEAVLSVNGEKAGTVHISRLYFQKGYDTTSIRATYYTEVAPDYEVPFEFEGDIVKLTIHSFGSKVSTQNELDKVRSAE